MYKPFFVLKDGRPVLGRDRVPPVVDAMGNPPERVDQILPNSQMRLFSFLRLRANRLFRREAPGGQQAPTKAHWPLHASFHSEYSAGRPLVWALIKEMSRISREHGAGFVVTLSPRHMRTAVDDPPWRVASFRREYQEDARASGITALDFVPEYFAEGGDDRFQLHEAINYPSPTGNGFIARETYRWIKELAKRGEEHRL